MGSDETGSAKAPVTSAPKRPKVYDNLAVVAEMGRQPGSLLFAGVNDVLPEEEQRLHRTYLLLVMSLAAKFMNGNKNGPAGSYNYRGGQLDSNNMTFDHGAPYYGHNIGAIAVDSTPKVIDFDFNHTEVLSSSIEHAESRLIRRLYSLTGLRSEKPLKENNKLNDVTIYTTLEPCAQCAGVMALANVKAAVYVQRDDGARSIANILYNLKPYAAAVAPIHASACGLRHADELTRAYDLYQKNVVGYLGDVTTKMTYGAYLKAIDDGQIKTFGTPFFVDANGEPEWTTSIASFLCTDYAREIYMSALNEFQGLEPGRPDVDDAQQFLQYAAKLGHRGTPH